MSKSILIVVTALDHPTEDAWVIERASEEADRSGVKLPKYQGLGETAEDGFMVHMYCDKAATADEARRVWAGQRNEARHHG